jgi:hypothetical protein
MFEVVHEHVFLNFPFLIFGWSPDAGLGTKHTVIYPCSGPSGGGKTPTPARICMSSQNTMVLHVLCVPVRKKLLFSSRGLSCQE